jgi:hypothetical protein
MDGVARVGRPPACNRTTKGRADRRTLEGVPYLSVVPLGTAASS